MEVDKKLKEKLVEILSYFEESIPVYRTRKLSKAEIEENAKYIALQFAGRESLANYMSVQREDDSTLISLPWDTKMRIYDNSNAIIIKRNLNPLRNLFNKNLDLNDLTTIAIDTAKRLKLDKWKLPFEQLEFESLSVIKVGGINQEEKKTPIIVCRIMAEFRRYINEIPVFLGASIFVKIAGGNMIESVGIDWRHIEEKPIDYPKIIEPEIGAEKILKEFNSAIPNRIVTSDDYEPEFFGVGYLSMPKRMKQNYMQPVYVATLKPLDVTTLSHVIIVPATNTGYEAIK